MSAGDGSRFDLVVRLVDGGDSSPAALLERLARLGSDWCGVSGIAVTAFDGDGPGLPMCASDQTARTLEALQSSLGEGPGVHAYRRGEPALVSDLGADRQWLHFSPAAASEGVGAVFGFPLRVGAANFGAMTLYRDEPGALGRDDYRGAVIAAEIGTSLLLAIQADGAWWSRADLEDFDNGWLVIHQATGMVSEQLGVGAETGLARLRASAYSSGQSLAEVAADIVARRARLDRDDLGRRPLDG